MCLLMLQKASNFIPRQAFTLLEVLLATALLTLLTTGILAIVSDFTASKTMFKSLRQEQDPSSLSPLSPNNNTIAVWSRLLEDDLLHSQTIEAQHDNELTLIGYGALEISDSGRSHRPVQVVYQLEEVAGTSCVIRRQTLLDIPSNQNMRRDLVCCGVRRFTITGSSATGTRPANSQPAGRPPSAPSAPDAGVTQWTLTAWVQGREAPAWEQILSSPLGGTP